MSLRPVNIFVPRLMDEANHNAQNLNAKALLLRFSGDVAVWNALRYGSTPSDLSSIRQVRIRKLAHGRFWPWHLLLLYQKSWDLIFYPGFERIDMLALSTRRLLRQRTKVVATLEGLVGDVVRERDLSQWRGHPVHCVHVPKATLRRMDRVLREADCVIGVSPFLAAAGERIYKREVQFLPLGIDTRIFHPRNDEPPTGFRVVGAGRLYANKRPEIFVELAKLCPSAEFVWFGDGELRESLIFRKDNEGIGNLTFAGAVSSERLADELRRSHLFVLPSRSEGAPKVLQEAAGCGLPTIAFGIYESPAIEDGKTGYVVWNDEQLIDRVIECIRNPSSANRMGESAALAARRWDWDLLAPQWETEILRWMN